MFVLVYEWLSLLEQRMFTCLWDVLKQRFSWPLPLILYKENNNINKNKNTNKRKEKKRKKCFPLQKLMNLHITFIIKAIWYNILNLILNTMVYKYIVRSLQYECKYIFSWFYQQTKLSHQANHNLFLSNVTHFPSCPFAVAVPDSKISVWLLSLRQTAPEITIIIML